MSAGINSHCGTPRDKYTTDFSNFHCDMQLGTNILQPEMSIMVNSPCDIQQGTNILLLEMSVRINSHCDMQQRTNKLQPEMNAGTNIPQVEISAKDKFSSMSNLSQQKIQLASYSRSFF